MLYGITPLDARTFAVVALAFAAVAAFASYVPARRASEVDPMVALRAEQGTRPAPGAPPSRAPARRGAAPFHLTL